MLDQLASFIETVIEKIGYLGVALLVGLENIIPVIPSEIVQPYAGFVAQKDGFSAVVVMVVVATIGSIIGALAMYWIAAEIGDDRLHLFIRKFGKWLHVRESDLNKAEEWFDRHATSAVFVGRCVPLIRSVISIPAGFRRMKLLPYTLYTALGSLLWNIALIGAGALLGENWERVGRYVGVFQWVVIALVAAAVARFVWTHVLKKP